MILWYWCEFGGFWRPKHQIPYSWWRKESFLLYYFCVSKFKRRQCKLSCNAKWENLGGQCYCVTCVTGVPLPPAIISMAKTSALKWQLQTNTELWFPSDNNECATEINICGAKGICQNTPGSFVCECQRGFSLDQTGQSCEGEYNTMHFPSLASLIFFQPYCHPRKDL